MALGKIKADTLEHSTAGSLDTQYVVNGSSKAWLQFNQTTPTTVGSFNTSSVTDTSEGRFDHNLTSAMVNTSDVSIVGMVNHESGNTNIRGIAFQRTNSGTFTSSKFPLEVVDMGDGNTKQDQSFVFTVIHGDLA